MAIGIPIIGDIIDAAKDLLGQVIVDKDKKNELNLELEKLRDIGNARAHTEILAQLDINKTEAQSGSVFVAGWRPFIGWVSGFALAVQSMLLPLISQISGKTYEINTELLLMTLGSMLGMGGLRSFDRLKGTATDDFTTVASTGTKTKTVTETTSTSPAPIIFAPPKEVVQALPEDTPWNK